MRSPSQHAQAARQQFESFITPRTPPFYVALLDAQGKIAACDIVAQFPSPRFDNSQMDGYALSDAALAGGAFVAGPTIPAGTDPDSLYPEGLAGKIAPIMTGAKIPAGTAAIVPVESCSPAEFAAPGETVTIPAAQHDQFIRRAGSDSPAGAVLIKKGTVLDAAALATLAGQGIDDVLVTATLRILVCTGGAEISAAPGAAGAPGVDETGRASQTSGAAAIPDSNAPLIAALAANYGIAVADYVHTDDDPEALRAQLAQKVTQHRPDAIVTSGGISAGKFEVVRQVLEPQPYGWFGHVNQQPGGPQGLSSFDGVPVFCLPGNPVSTLVSFRLFVAPALAPAHTPDPIVAELSEARTGLDKREQFLRGRLSYHDGRITAHPVGGEGSHLISQAIGATCLIQIPAASTLNPGDLVTVYPL